MFCTFRFVYDWNVTKTNYTAYFMSLADKYPCILCIPKNHFSAHRLLRLLLLLCWAVCRLKAAWQASGLDRVLQRFSNSALSPVSFLTSFQSRHHVVLCSLVVMVWIWFQNSDESNLLYLIEADIPLVINETASFLIWKVLFGIKWLTRKTWPSLFVFFARNSNDVLTGWSWSPNPLLHSVAEWLHLQFSALQLHDTGSVVS